MSGGGRDCDLCERASLETAADHGWRVGVCKKSRLCLIETVWVEIMKTFLEKKEMTDLRILLFFFFLLFVLLLVSTDVGSVGHEPDDTQSCM